MEESQIDAGALPGSIPQQEGVQGRNDNSQIIVNRHLSEVSNEDNQQRQQQNAQPDRPNVEAIHAIIRQPGGGEVSQDDPSRNATVTSNDLRQSGRSQDNHNLPRDEFGNIHGPLVDGRPPLRESNRNLELARDDTTQVEEAGRQASENSQRQPTYYIQHTEFQRRGGAAVSNPQQRQRLPLPGPPEENPMRRQGSALQHSGYGPYIPQHERQNPYLHENGGQFRWSQDFPFQPAQQIRQSPIQYYGNQGNEVVNDETSLADMLKTRLAHPTSDNPFLSADARIQEQQRFLGLQPSRFTGHVYPSQKNSDFVSAMSQIARNTDMASTGSGVNKFALEKELNDQIKMGLALKMGLNDSVHLNKRALSNVLSSIPSRANLKQILQARAELYSECLDPKLFTRNTDLVSKVGKTKQKENSARSSLVAAPLLVAQLDARDLREMMVKGDQSVLHSIKCGTRGTAAQFLKALAKIPVMDVIRLMDKQKANEIANSFLRQAEDLDFVQDMLSACAKYEDLNPLLNALLDAFGRRRKSRRFKEGPHCLDLDRLRHLHTRNVNINANRSSPVNPNTQRKQLFCRFYQRGFCHYDPCKYIHQCSNCLSQSHGVVNCTSRRFESHSLSNRQGRLYGEGSGREVPPNPRFRRDRAR